MTLDELRRKYEAAYKIAKRERVWRERVFAHDPIARALKVKEMDELLATLEWMKDALKAHCEPAPNGLPPEGAEQGQLLDVPRPKGSRGGYP